MTAEILSVGTELLLGDIINTNAAFIARELKQLGISAYFQTVVGDNKERLIAALNSAAARSDIIITTGGLGPTADDITKETAAEFLGLELTLDENLWNGIREGMLKRGRPVTENNKKQALLPNSGRFLHNANGTAPGVIMEKNGKTVILLPGPPFEMEAMFKNEVIPIIIQKTDTRFYSKTLRICGIGESQAEDMLKDVIETQTNPTIAPYAKSFEVHFRVTAASADAEAARKLAQPVIDKIYAVLGENIYGEDETTLEEAVISLLLKKKLTLACAESCTGGLIASRLVNVSGVSAVFMEGIVSYSNESKVTRLGVSPETIEKYGAVSKQTALEMAAGAARVLNCGVGLSVTGIAGAGATGLSVAATDAAESNIAGADIAKTAGRRGVPESDICAEDKADKQTGLVFIGIFVGGHVTAEEFHFTGSRNRIRGQSAQTALDLLRRKLLNGN